MTSEEIVEFVEGLARVSASGGGPKALADHLAGAVGAGVLIEDAQWRHIAAAGSAAMPASGRGVVEAGAPGRTLRIVAGRTHVGWLSVFPAGTSLPAQPRLESFMRLAASAIGVELARDAGGSRVRQRSFWERLIARTYHDANAARDDAAARGITLAPAYLTVALELDPAGETRPPAAVAELRTLAADVFRCGDGDLGFLERGTALIVFVPTVREVDASNARTAATLLPKTIAKRKPHMRISGGAGTIEAPLALHAGAAAAEAALAIGRRMHGPGRVTLYEELGAYPLLYEGADTVRLQAFAARALARLRAYDEKHQTELERTLKLYFQVGQNVKTAAAQLNVHRHTVFYRLRQIGEICACSLESPHDQLTLRLAVAIDALHNST